MMSSQFKNKNFNFFNGAWQEICSKKERPKHKYIVDENGLWGEVA